MSPFPLTYVFRPDETRSHGFARVLGVISVRARGLTRRSREPTIDSIHEVRLLIKRARALLWFARPPLDAATTARARTRLREAAGLLAGQRDLAVTQSTLEELTRKAAKARDRSALASIFEHLVRNPAAVEARKKSLRPLLKKAVGILRRAVAEIKRSAAKGAEWSSPSERVSKAFHATRQAGKRAQRTGKNVDFHTWRKKAKRLLYQLELTQAEPGRRMARVMKRVAKLQDKLGAYHDCVVVGDHLRRRLPLSSAARHVADLLEKRKARLRKSACKIARRLDSSI